MMSLVFEELHLMDYALSVADKAEIVLGEYKAARHAVGTAQRKDVLEYADISPIPADRDAAHRPS